MTVNIKQARELCTADEKELVDESGPRRIKEHSAADLKQKVNRARKLRDKYRDLADKQRREMRGKQPPGRPAKATSNDATRTKQELFAELLARFERALAETESPAPGRTAGGEPKEDRASESPPTINANKQSSAMHTAANEGTARSKET